MQDKVYKQIQIAHANHDVKANAMSISKKLRCSRQLVSRHILVLRELGRIEKQTAYRPVE